MAKGNGSENTPETTVEETEKAPRKPKFSPPSAEAISEAGEFDSYTSKERKVKGGGTKPATTFRIAKNRKQLLALFGGDEKVMNFYASLAAANLADKDAAKNSPERLAEKNEKRAAKLLETLSPNVLAALIAKASAR